MANKNNEACVVCGWSGVIPHGRGIPCAGCEEKHRLCSECSRRYRKIGLLDRRAFRTEEYLIACPTPEAETAARLMRQPESEE